MPKIPVAVVGDVTAISGVYTWCAVGRDGRPRVLRTNATKSSAPVITMPPALAVSLTKSSAKIARHPAQSLVSSRRQYLALSCLIASISASISDCSTITASA